MDGTLVDSFELIAESFNYALRRFLNGTLSTEEALSVPGWTLEDQLANYIPSSAIPHAMDRYYTHFMHRFNSRTRIFPGIRGLLFTLHRRGIKLAVCTGADKKTASYTLARSGLSQFFTTVVTVDDVSKPKPDPEGLRIAMKTIGARSDQTVYLGDHPNDIKGSWNAGVKSAAAYWGSMHRNELEELKPNFSFNHPSEALALSAFQFSQKHLD